MSFTNIVEILNTQNFVESELDTIVNICVSRHSKLIVSILNGR
jgi:hypothetical protein